jgi:hypothetical protein
MHKKMRDIRNEIQDYQNYICQLCQSWLGYRLDKPVFHSREEKLMFHIETWRPFQGTIQRPIQWESETYSGGQNNRDVKLTTHCNLVKILRMNRAVPPLPLYALKTYTGIITYAGITREVRRGTTGSRGTQSQYYCPIRPIFKILIAKHSELCHLSYVVLTGRRRWHWWHWCSVTV